MAHQPSQTHCPIPPIGLGTWKAASGLEVQKAVEDAIDCGYRHLDCALAYCNEIDVGKAIANKIKDGTIKGREELFITGKLFNCFHRKENVEGALRQTINDLGCGYLDLYLIHWPVDFAYKWQSGETDFTNPAKLFPKITDESSENFNRMELDQVDKLETWKELERLVLEEKLIKYIGLSNFNEQQIEKIYSHPDVRVKPTVLQVECHPFLPQEELLKYCKSKSIALTAYSPLGGAAALSGEDAQQISPLHNPLIKEIALKYIDKKTGEPKNAGQVCLKWNIQRGVVVIPKSVSKSRIQANLDVGNDDVDDWRLSEEDMVLITKQGNDRRWRGCVPSITCLKSGKPLPRDAKHPDFPFTELLQLKRFLKLKGTSSAAVWIDSISKENLEKIMSSKLDSKENSKDSEKAWETWNILGKLQNWDIWSRL